MRYLMAQGNRPGLCIYLDWVIGYRLTVIGTGNTG